MQKIWLIRKQNAIRCPRAVSTAVRRRPGVAAVASVLLCALSLTGLTLGQTVPAAQLITGNSDAATPPVHITLAEAERRARKIEPTWMAAQVARGTAKYDRRLALAALLPQANFHGEALYTQPNGIANSGPLPGTIGPVFIANNSIREYVTQAQVSDKISVAGVARYRQASALSLQAHAEAEIATRGLHAVVTLDFYTVLAAQHKLIAAQAAEREAQRFVDLTEKLEAGREVAHADVIKAQLQSEQRQRDLADAKLALLGDQQAFGVLLFADPSTAYELDDNLDAHTDVPAEAQVRALASQSNPELRSAFAGLQASKQDVRASWAGYLPALTLGYNYGIDAPYFDSSGPGGRQFLGYSLSASLDFPLWDWFSTHDRVKQSELREHQAQATLNYTQRQLIAGLNQNYGELQTAATAFASLQVSVGQARESLHLTTLRYQSGEATVLEVVDAQNTYLAAEAAVADGAVRYHLARANLERLTGRLP